MQRKDCRQAQILTNQSMSWSMEVWYKWTWTLVSWTFLNKGCTMTIYNILNAVCSWNCVAALCLYNFGLVQQKRAQLLQNTHTHNYTARWQAGRSGSTTLLRNRIKLSAFHSYAALYCMHWISPLFTNASKLRKRRVGKDWKCWAETCRAKPHVVAEHACTKGRITYRSIHAYNFSSTFFGCEWKASSCWILYILYSTSNKANIHMHAHGTMSFLPILSLAS